MSKSTIIVCNFGSTDSGNYNTIPLTLVFGSDNKFSTQKEAIASLAEDLIRVYNICDEREVNEKLYYVCSDKEGCNFVKNFVKKDICIWKFCPQCSKALVLSKNTNIEYCQFSSFLIKHFPYTLVSDLYDYEKDLVWYPASLPVILNSINNYDILTLHSDAEYILWASIHSEFRECPSLLKEFGIE